jgi:hypothetical protein
VKQITINAIAILPSQEDRLRLGEIFRHSRWHLDLSGSLNDARGLLNKPHVGVVLTDCHLPDGGWKDVLNDLEPGRLAAPPVIVVSRSADERLWAKVLNLCGCRNCSGIDKPCLSCSPVETRAQATAFDSDRRLFLCSRRDGPFSVCRRSCAVLIQVPSDLRGCR